MSKEIELLKAMIREQLEVSDNWRSRAITILVAIYVPLAFVSSLFGMNLATSNDIQPILLHSSDAVERRDSSPSVSELDTLPFNIQGFTNTSSSMTWTSQKYIKVAVPLTFGTIVLPLVVGTLFRFMAQTAYRCRRWLKPLSILLLVVWEYLLYAFLAGEASPAGYQNILFILTGHLHLFGETCRKLYVQVVAFTEALDKRKARRRLWWLTTFLTTQILCFFGHLYYSFNFPNMMGIPEIPAAIPWIILAIVYTWPFCCPGVYGIISAGSQTILRWLPPPPVPPTATRPPPLNIFGGGTITNVE